MKYTVTVEIQLDPDAPFIESGEYETAETIMEIFKDMIYDQDYIKLEYVEVEIND